MFLQFTISLPQILYEICEKKNPLKILKLLKLRDLKMLQLINVITYKLLQML